MHVLAGLGPVVFLVLYFVYRDRQYVAAQVREVLNLHLHFWIIFIVVAVLSPNPNPAPITGLGLMFLVATFAVGILIWTGHDVRYPLLFRPIRK